MDLGGGDGITTELAYKAMEESWLSNGRSLHDLTDRLIVTFIEPSVGMMSDATERLNKIGLRYYAFSIPAHLITDFVEPDSQDICMETAALHHYSNPQKPYTAVHKVLKPGGAFVLNEWCHSLFEHPLRFRELLEKLNWTTKEEDLQIYNEFWIRRK